MSFNINMKQPQKPKIAMKDKGSITDTIGMTGNALSQEQKEVSNVEFGNSVRDNLLQKEIRAIRDEVEEKINSLDLDQYIEKSETPGLIKNDGSIDTTNYTSEEYVADVINNVRSDIQDDIDILENNLKELINAEADIRAETDTVLDKKIDDEITNREAAITQEVADRNIAIGVETTARENADVALQQDINSKQSQLSNTQLEAVNSGINSTKVGNYDTHISNTNNPHSVTKEQVGLGNVENKSVSTIQSEILTNENIISALGYTPYNSTNPAEYITAEGVVKSVNGLTPNEQGAVSITIPEAPIQEIQVNSVTVSPISGIVNIDIPAQVQSNWNETVTTAPSYIQNKPSLATVAITGKYVDLLNTPNLSIYAQSSSLSSVAFSGNYNDLTNKPTIPVTSVNGYTGDVSLTATDIGLGNVINTTDSATPTENGTSKFTNGGAYTMQNELQTNINTKVQEITVINTIIDTWFVNDNPTYANYGYVSNKTIQDLVAAKYVNVSFSLNDLEANVICPIQEVDTDNGILTIYSNDNSTITIPYIYIFK